MVNLEKQITFNDGLDEQDLEVPVGELEARFDREELGRLALEQEESRENPIDYVEIAYEKIKGLILRHRYISVLTVAVLTAIIISLTLLTIVLPQTIKFDFLKEQSCVFSPSLLPNLLKSDTKEFNLSRPAAMTYKQTPLFSLKVCATAVEAPIANENFTISQKLRIANYNLVNKTITVATGNYINASIDLDDKQVKSLTLTKPINFKLEQADRVFDYYLAADDKSVKCEKTL